MVDIIESEVARARCVVPGLVDSIVESPRERERYVDLGMGPIGTEKGTEEEGDVAASRPVLTLCGAGFFLGLPVAKGDEGIGLVSDRATGAYLENRTFRQFSPTTGERYHDASDALIAPFAITAPPGAPPTWDHLIMGGDAGVSLDVWNDGRMALQCPSDSGGRQTFEVNGRIVFVTGATIEAGGTSSLAKSSQTVSAITAIATAFTNSGNPVLAGAAQGILNALQGISTTTLLGD